MYNQKLIIAADRSAVHAFFTDYANTNGYSLSQRDNELIAKARSQPSIFMRSEGTNFSISVFMVGGFWPPPEFLPYCKSLREAAIFKFGAERVSEMKN